jgi:hypothetical protein
LTIILIIGHVGSGTPILGAENLDGYLESDRLVGDRSNLFVLWVEEDLVSDLRERQLGHTLEWPPGSVSPWEACIRTTEQLLETLTDVVFLHRTIQRGLGLNGTASRLHRSHSSAVRGWLVLPIPTIATMEPSANTHPRPK